MNNYKIIESNNNNSIKLREESLSDLSKVYSVKIEEDDKMEFMVIECLDYLGAKKLYDSLNETVLSINIY